MYKSNKQSLLLVILMFFLLFGTFRYAKAFSIDNHIDITQKGLPFLKDDVVNDIADETPETMDTATGQIHPEWHFDSCSFKESVDHINSRYASILAEISQGNYSFDPEEDDTADYFGRLLHTAQDFYAHSNWVELDRTDLFETGIDYWSEDIRPFNFYEEKGVLVIEETDTVDMESWVFDHIENNEKYVIVISAGTDGLISGEAYSPVGCPPEVSIGHWDSDPDNPEAELWPDCNEIDSKIASSLGFCYEENAVNRISGSGLNKDKFGRPGFPEARDLAIAQTTHEWCRLLNLVKTELGEESKNKLFEAWVDPVGADVARTVCSTNSDYDVYFTDDTDDCYDYKLSAIDCETKSGNHTLIGVGINWESEILRITIETEGTSLIEDPDWSAAVGINLKTAPSGASYYQFGATVWSRRGSNLMQIDESTGTQSLGPVEYAIEEQNVIMTIPYERIGITAQSEFDLVVNFVGNRQEGTYQDTLPNQPSPPFRVQPPAN